MTRGQAHKVLEAAFMKAGLNGKLATHSMRKSYAQRMYDAMGDIYAVKEVLGHQSVETTKKYLGVSYQKLQRASEEIAVNQVNKRTLLYHSADDLPDDTILLQAIKRGLIDKEAMIHSQLERNGTSSDGKIIPLQRARFAHTTKLRRGQG
jgi:hypothetical protein